MLGEATTTSFTYHHRTPILAYPYLMHASSFNIYSVSDAVCCLLRIFILGECDGHRPTQDQMSCQPIMLVRTVVSIPVIPW
jgi:hypothetical protein